MKTKLFLLTIIFGVTSLFSMAQIIHVPADQPTIQAGIDISEHGDTVLVQPGTYIENISFNGKSITVASLFLITGDTSYITQTIIDGNQEGTVVTFNFNDTLNVVLSGFTITNGLSGIWCGQSSSPLIKNMKIIHNGPSAGGIHIGNFSTAKLENMTIEENSVYDPNYLNPGGNMDLVGYGQGGGIRCSNYSSPELKNVIIKNNIADGVYGGLGGGMYLSAPCGPVMENVTITGNYAAGDGWGGGICCRYVFWCESELYQHQYHDINNKRMRFEFEWLTPVFDSINRCNIYLNKAALGSDLYFSENSYDSVHLVLDTFTVITPTEFHAVEFDNLYFDINHAKLEQVDADLYISPAGNDNNSGLTPDQPLKTIYRANSKIMADSLHPHTIHIAEGSYSPSATGEFFPINLPEYINLIGESENGSIINAEDTAGVLYLLDNQFNHISGLTITGGWKPEGGGIYCFMSSPLLENLTISDNSTQGKNLGGVNPGAGGGIYFESSTSPILRNISIHDNSSGSGGGVYFGCIPVFDSVELCDIYSNRAVEGNDLFTISKSLIRVIVDTFSVLNPREFHAAELSGFSFDILHGMYEQKSADLFVSPNGNDLNSGLNETEPLKTIQTAFSVIIPDSLNHRTIYLQQGIYSTSTTGEFFPVKIPDYINLEGISVEEVVLDAKQIGCVILTSKSNRISGLTLTGGKSFRGGGINSINCYNCSDNDLLFENLKITGNSCGIFCSRSNPTIKNVTIANNNLGFHLSHSSPTLENIKIANNSRYGIYCSENSSPVLKNILITGTSGNRAAIYLLNQCNPVLENITLTGNSYGYGTIRISANSNPVLINTICWDNAGPEIVFPVDGHSPSTITISYSNILGGLEGIVTNNLGTVNWLEGNINEDPQFTGIGDHLYALATGSPCINSGTPDTIGLYLPPTDLAGNPRVWNNRIDIGAYEWNNVGVEDFRSTVFDLRLKIYPNPFYSSTTIEFELEQPGNIEITIMNQFGQEVYNMVRNGQQGINQVTWDAGSLPAGVYICRIMTNCKYGMKKMVVVK